MSEELPRVLVAAPTADHKDYCLDRWAKMVNSFNYPNYDVFVVDNSKDPEHTKELWKRGIRAVHYQPEEGQNPSEYITECQNFIRKVAIDKNYDYLLMLETDVFVYNDIIEYMVTADKPCYSLTYFLKQGNEATLSIQAMTTNRKYKKMRVIEYQEAFHLAGKKLNLSERSGKWQDYFATGIGCTMIRRDLLFEQKFRVDTKKYQTAFSDSFWHYDLYQKGIENILDLKYFCEHDRRDWDELYQQLKLKKHGN